MESSDVGDVSFMTAVVPMPLANTNSADVNLQRKSKNALNAVVIGR